MTSLAPIDQALLRPDLNPLDLASFLVARKRVFEDLRGKGTTATEPEGPKGEE